MDHSNPYLAFMKTLNDLMAPPTPSSPPNDAKSNFQTFIFLRRDFRDAFATRVLQPVHVAPRIDVMVTAATNAVLEDTKKRNITSILGPLCNDGSGQPQLLDAAEALAFLWVYVGTAEAVTRRSGPIWVTQSLDGHLGFLFKQAVSLDKEKNLPHVAHLWRKVRQCHPPKGKFPSVTNIFKVAYGDLDLDMVPTLEAGMELLFEEMSSFYGNLKNPSMNAEMNDKSIQQEIDNCFLKIPQYRGQQSDKDLPPKAIMTPSSSTFGSAHSPQKAVPVGKAEEKSIVVPAFKLETSSSSEQTHRPRSGSYFVQQIRQLLNNNDAPVPLDNQFLRFLTNPGEYVRLNPSVFPEDNVNWSARKLLSDQPNEIPEVVPQTPVDCTETLLRVDFTAEEYIDQTTASNYYAQGVKIVDGVRRVVLFHEKINFFGINKDQV
ncbi:uncharacterized protein LOC118437523 [Folsomia candida]|uniref:Uncharacterized protein n=1 Tax=Folsomia candida TaxID=158441 RepID=A0A226DQM5_FOLCA|nr:uncharacterized protein LOC118437523 [Folsomia candida]OXA47390.1 hypothetical protein Fcan01_18018 [Folsomia candida]